ncbi:hypothetical protein KAH55_07090, partial [bacterium]|nr:hypothetical protein [bacterium]
QSSIIASQYDYNDPLYKGYKWRGMAAYTEQAYMTWHNENFQVKFGRDFLRWGPGKSGSLIMSNICRPLDMVQAAAFWGPFRYSFLAAELDPFSGNVRRFLSGHRLAAKFLDGRVEAAITELVLYGGENKTFNFVYLNPVIFYHGAKKNGAGDNNVLPAVDLSLFPLKNWQVYGSLLIDDIQVEKTVTGDLEPNEIGWLAGTGWAAPFGFSGLDVNLEYVRVANRTYKTSHYQEIYLHRNVPIGHPLGNDFDHWQFTAHYWPTSGFKVTLDTWYTRNGEGSLNSPWDEPWNDSTLDEGYEEAFPTGVVEKKLGLGVEANWFFKPWLRFSGNFSWESV